MLSANQVRMLFFNILALVLIALIAASSPAFAAGGNDGTSRSSSQETIQQRHRRGSNGATRPIDPIIIADVPKPNPNPVSPASSTAPNASPNRSN